MTPTSAELEAARAALRTAFRRLGGVAALARSEGGAAKLIEVAARTLAPLPSPARGPSEEELGDIAETLRLWKAEALDDLADRIDAVRLNPPSPANPDAGAQSGVEEAARALLAYWDNYPIDSVANMAFLEALRAALQGREAEAP